MKSSSIHFNNAPFSHRSFVRAATSILLILCLMGPQVHAAVDAFIWFVPASSALPIEGETTDEFFKAKKAFEIKDFSFGVENPTTIGSATGGAGAGKIKFNEFTIKKTSDKASAAFFKNCATGSHYQTVIIALRNAGGDGSNDPYLYFQFQPVFTTKIVLSGHG